MKKMSLLEKYQKGLLKEGDYIPNFKPDKGSITITKKDTGWTGQQIISTQNLRYRFAGIIGNKAILLSDTVTRHKIFLSGKIGYKKGPRTLKKILEKCYSSKQFKAQGFILSKEIFDKIPKSLINYIRDEYWLDTKWAERLAFSGDEEKGLFCADFIVRKYALFRGSIIEHTCRKGILPAVYLPIETLLDEKNNIVFKEQK